MKFREGFVSNSSSSSFCILGVCVDKRDFKLPSGRTIEEMQEEDSNFDEYEIFDDLKFDDLEAFTGYEGDDDSVYIGITPDDFKDDETIGQIKDKILATLKKYDIKIGKQKVRFIEESTGNG